MADRFPPGRPAQAGASRDSSRRQGGSHSATIGNSGPGKPASGKVAGNGKAAASASIADFRYRPPAPAPVAVESPEPTAPREAVPRTPFAPRLNGTRRQAYAALDLGTNNCRLLIARPSGPNFTVIDAFSRVVRLGEDLAMTGRLSDAAMDRALSALDICAEKLRRRNVHLARSVATEACRRAANGERFIERVREETGIVLDIITAQEEARLAVLGCHILLEDGDSPAVIFDIGGGSTELVLIEPRRPAESAAKDGAENGGASKVPRILDWQSVPYGVVSLTDTIGRSEGNEAERIARYTAMRDLVRDSFAPFTQRIADTKKSAKTGADIRLLGTSGTVTTLASLHLELPHYDRNAVDGLIVPSDDMRDICTRLSTMSQAERRALPCIGADRADLVVAGCAILEAIIDIWPATRLGVADRGIREGILRGLMAADHAQFRSGGAIVTGARKDPDRRVRTAKKRTQSSTNWLERQLNDPYVKRAKAEGYRSRSAYKLLELDTKFKLLRGTGGWSIWASRRAAGHKWFERSRRARQSWASICCRRTRSKGSRSWRWISWTTPPRQSCRRNWMDRPISSCRIWPPTPSVISRPITLRTMGLVEAAAWFAIETSRAGRDLSGQGAGRRHRYRTAQFAEKALQDGEARQATGQPQRLVGMVCRGAGVQGADITTRPDPTGPGARLLFQKQPKYFLN